MQTNNLFSTRRFLLLFRQSLIINKKIIATSLAGAAGILFIALFLFQSMNNYKHWTNFSTMVIFLFCYISLGGIYTSQSFPAFRTKEKSLVYLLLPASAAEKFVFEFLTRIGALILLMPPLFWIVANLEGAVVHHYYPSLINYKFSFIDGFGEVVRKGKLAGWNMFPAVQFCLFVFVVTFTGACHFSKSPRTKTSFTLAVIVGGYALLGYLLFKGLNLKDYSMMGKSILFFRNKEDSWLFLSIAGIVVNLSLIAIAWFRFKEKEV